MGGAHTSIRFIDSTIHNHGVDVGKNALDQKARQMGERSQKMENSPALALCG
jgi:hypothetical protein